MYFSMDMLSFSAKSDLLSIQEYIVHLLRIWIFHKVNRQHKDVNKKLFSIKISRPCWNLNLGPPQYQAATNWAILAWILSKSRYKLIWNMFWKNTLK